MKHLWPLFFIIGGLFGLSFLISGLRRDVSALSSQVNALSETIKGQRP